MMNSLLSGLVSKLIFFLVLIIIGFFVYRYITYDPFTKKIDGLEITLNTSAITNTMGEGWSEVRAHEGNQFVVINLTVNNASQASYLFLPRIPTLDTVKVKLVYKRTYEYIYDSLVSGDLPGSMIAPRAQAAGILAFQVPDEFTGSLNDFQLVFFSGTNRSITFDLKNIPQSRSTAPSPERGNHGLDESIFSDILNNLDIDNIFRLLDQ